MKSTRPLFVMAGVALLAWLICIGLFLQLTSYDPYAWAFPGVESDLSRSLYLERQFLYIKVGIASFLLAVGMGLAGIYFKRRNAK
jgi:hypothetical protein